MLKLFYKTSDLANILKTTNNRTTRIMNKLNIPKSKIGRFNVYYLSDIQENAPQFASSLIAKDNEEIDI